MPPFTGEQTEVQRGQVICPKSQLIREELGLGFEVFLKGKLLQQFWTWGSPAVECESNQLFGSVLGHVIYLWQRHFASLCIYESGPTRRESLGRDLGDPARSESKLYIHLYLLSTQVWSWLSLFLKGCEWKKGGGGRGGQLRLDPGTLSGVGGTLSRL